MLIKESDGTYTAKDNFTSDDILSTAKDIIRGKLTYTKIINSSADVKDYLIHELALLEYEAFHVIFLTNRHDIICSETLFKGTIDKASVYPREVAKRALQLNASALIVAHNHPSGRCLPSSPDKAITTKLREALSLVDIRLLDHIIVGGADTYSFADDGTF